MLLNLSFIFLIGIVEIRIATSKSILSDHDAIEFSDLQKLLEMFQDGNVRNSHTNQQETHHGKTLHEEDLNPMNTQALPFRHNNLRREKLVEKKDQKSNRVNKIMCAITGSYGCIKNDDLDHIQRPNVKKSLDDADPVNVNKEKLTHHTGETEDSDDPEYKNHAKEARNDLKLLLDDLEKKLLVQEDTELKCKGNGCGRGKEDKKTGEVRFKDRCESRIDDDDKDQLRCGKNKCGKGRGRGYHTNKLLRCIGDRCGRSRVDDNNGDNIEYDKHDDLRCRKNRCKTGRDGNYDDTSDVDNGNELRYEGNRCVHIDDEYYDDRKDNNEHDQLRCSGNHCGTNRNHISGADIDSDFKTVLDYYGKRYKINNELDAIVLDVDKLENGLEALNSSKNYESEEIRRFRYKPKIYKVPRHQKMQLLNKTTNKNQKPRYIPKKHQPGRSLTISELIDFMKERLLDTYVNIAINFIEDDNVYGEFREFYNKPGVFTRSDQNFLKELKKMYHTLFVFPMEERKERYKKYVTDYFGKKTIRVVPGRTDKIVLPEWLYSEMNNDFQRRNKLKQRPFLRSKKKRLLPLTMKQKIRLNHGNTNRAKTLIPFVLDVKGLGQVNP